MEICCTDFTAFLKNWQVINFNLFKKLICILKYQHSLIFKIPMVEFSNVIIFISNDVQHMLHTIKGS